jgi:hypothetical protein
MSVINLRKNSNFDSDPATPTLPDIMTLRDLANFFWSGRHVVAFCFLVSLFFASIYVLIASPRFEASMLIGPPSTPTGNLSDRDSPLGNSGTVASLIGLSGHRDSVDSFDQFQLLINSEVVGRELSRDPQIMQTLFADQWNKQTKNWEPAKGLVPHSVRLVHWLLGRGEWSAPGGGDVASYVAENVRLQPVNDNGAVKLAYRSTDRVFAKYFLNKVESVTDGIIRETDKARFEKYQLFLGAQIPSATAVELRLSLVQTYTAVTQRIMLVTAGQAYSISVLDGPNVTKYAVSPSLPLTFLICGFLGIVVGCVFVLFDKLGYLPSQPRFGSRLLHWLQPENRS